MPARLPVWLGLVFLATQASAAPIALREVRQGLFGTCFATDRDGWMVGELGRIFHTSDGGATWERQDAGTKRPLLAVACVDARTAWIAGKEGSVFGTTDGGATWAAATTGSSRHIFALGFANRQRGHAAGDFGTMVHTEDGGHTWAVAHVPPEVELPASALDAGVDPGDVNLYALSYGDADHLWVVGEFGIIMASEDGGRTFHQQRSGVESTLFGVHFSDAERGWAVGIDSVILRTEDGGATWAPQRAPTQQRSLYDVFVQGARGWVVGDQGTVLISSDGGGSWTVELLPIEFAARWIRSVWLTRTGVGLAVGAEGLVFGIEGNALRLLGGDTPETHS
ncbi:MAG TPA: YCF48-related protein [Candidatus Nitrosopolaris sp.]|nr:YCF48-related protein [Candidatus Nitrosopolaris sp.]